MENIYTAYTKKINDEVHYFVKHYTRFKDIDGSPAILSEYGMHKDFFKACAIAKIYEETVVMDLSAQVFLPATPAKVISFNASKQRSHSILRNTQNLLSKLRLAGLNYFL